MADADTVSRAARIASAMPLVHYPASARLTDWSTWGGLTSRSARGFDPAPGRFGRLRDEHVFVYAGPCCYYHGNCVGDAVLYFAAGAEEGRTGSATPFDSGSLEDEPPKLQPFRANASSEDERWSFFEAHRVVLSGWREHFAAWLTDCYDQPDRYMDSTPDRYAAGQPDRTRPPELLEHNGTRGRTTYGSGESGDRRAWIWEVRIEARLEFDNLALLNVPFDAIQRATEFIEDYGYEASRRPQIRALEPNLAVSADVLYQASGPILQELIGP